MQQGHRTEARGEKGEAPRAPGLPPEKVVGVGAGSNYLLRIWARSPREL